MHFHRLKVVKFDENLKAQSSAKEFINFTKSTNNDRFENDATRPQNNKLKLNLIIHKSQSEPLKYQRNDKILRKHLRKKTISFDGIKKNFNYKNSPFIFINSRRLKKGKRLRERDKQLTERNKEVKVLFASEMTKLTKGKRNVYCSSKQRNAKLPSFPTRANISYDVFGFQNRNCLLDRTSKKKRCDKNCFAPKLLKLGSGFDKINSLLQSRQMSKSSSEPKLLKFQNTRALKMIKSDLNHCVCANGQHYNLISFPGYTKQGRNVGRTRNNLIYSRPYRPNCICKDQQVSVTPSRLQTIKKSTGDAAVVTSNSLSFKPLDSNGTSKPSCRKCKKAKYKQRCCVLQRNLQRMKNFFSLMRLCTCYESKIKIILKYILLSFVIVTWIPCIIAVSFYWVLTYPMRPQETNETIPCNDDDCSRKKALSFKNMRSMKGFTDKAGNAVKPLSSLLKNKKKKVEQQPIISATCSRRYPDPRKKYTLTYSDRRGWRMKAIRKQKSNKNHHNVQVFQNPKHIISKRCQTEKKVKHKSGVYKLRSVESKINIPFGRNRMNSLRNKSQNTKSCKQFCGCNETVTYNEKFLRRPVGKSKFVRSKSYSMPYDSLHLGNKTSINKCLPCLRNSISSPLPLNTTNKYRRNKSSFTRHHTSRNIGSQEPKSRRIMCKDAYEYPCPIVKKKPFSRKANTCCMCQRRKKSLIKRLTCYFYRSYCRLEKTICETDDDAWQDINCDMLIQTPKSRSSIINRYCPSVYSCCVTWLKCMNSLWYVIVYMLSFCVWCPVMLCCYLCTKLICQCLK